MNESVKPLKIIGTVLCLILYVGIINCPTSTAVLMFVCWNELFVAKLSQERKYASYPDAASHLTGCWFVCFPRWIEISCRAITIQYSCALHQHCMHCTLPVNVNCCCDVTHCSEKTDSGSSLLSSLAWFTEQSSGSSVSLSHFHSLSEAWGRLTLMWPMAEWQLIWHVEEVVTVL